MEGRFYIKSAMLWVWGAVAETKGNTRHMFNTSNEPNIKTTITRRTYFQASIILVTAGSWCCTLREGIILCKMRWLWYVPNYWYDMPVLVSIKLRLLFLQSCQTRKQVLHNILPLISDNMLPLISDRGWRRR